MSGKMGVLGIAPIVVLILHLYGVRGDLPMLPGNRLLTGAPRFLPGAEPIGYHYYQRHTMIGSDFKRKKTVTLSEALTDSTFKKYTFNSDGVKDISIVKHGGLGVFSVAMVQHGFIRSRTAYSLQVDGSGDRAYWLPQGGVIDVPKIPTTMDPKYVFTPDFSGCSWTVTPMDNGMLRLRHVEGDKENAQFNNLSEEQKGGPTTYAMQYKDYGYIHKYGKLIQHYQGYAYMKFSNGKWTLHAQHQTSSYRFGKVVLNKNKQIETVKITYSNQNPYSDITDTEFFRIP